MLPVTSQLNGTARQRTRLRNEPYLYVGPPEHLEGTGDVEEVGVLANGNNDHRIVWHVDHALGPAYDSAGNGVSHLAVAWPMTPAAWFVAVGELGLSPREAGGLRKAEADPVSHKSILLGRSATAQSIRRKGKKQRGRCCPVSFGQGRERTMRVTRRQFMKVSAAGLAASSVGALGFVGAGEALAAGVRPFRLEKATETRNTCPYCAVSCGVLVYSVADAKDGKAKLI